MGVVLKVKVKRGHSAKMAELHDLRDLWASWRSEPYGLVRHFGGATVGGNVREGLVSKGHVAVLQHYIQKSLNRVREQAKQKCPGNVGKC